LKHTDPSNNPAGSRHPIKTQLQQLNNVTQNEFEQAQKLIELKLQTTMNSLQQSAATIEMLLTSQSPADIDTPAGIALRQELQSLLATSTHLAELTKRIKKEFADGRALSEKRTGYEIANVCKAVDIQTTFQEDAMALTAAILEKARAKPV
jgi:hypothetical protein